MSRYRPQPATDTAATHRALRTIAAFEALKGVVALVAGVGVLGLLHSDLHAIAVALIGHVGLSPGQHYPALLLGGIDRWAGDGDWQWLTAAAAGYAALRFAEAWGLWRDKAWGEWLGALSGGLYIPFELWHWAHRPTWAASAVVLLNAGVVAYLGWRLCVRRGVVPQA
ncbi:MULTISPECIES: DUF2127 domain-containing protein [unclassified Acidovorax]|uniref:DUF2127 domain-containing protein n=1 Tax=unclassified Acidovorax TaxID=2684926 RepID=UPI0028833E56|nr:MULTISPECIES: DUF2127 domain-containing protein [unclassified Acidovorax]